MPIVGASDVSSSSDLIFGRRRFGGVEEVKSTHTNIDSEDDKYDEAEEDDDKNYEEEEDNDEEEEEDENDGENDENEQEGEKRNT